jgi:hypothetical protein
MLSPGVQHFGISETGYETPKFALDPQERGVGWDTKRIEPVDTLSALLSSKSQFAILNPAWG